MTWEGHEYCWEKQPSSPIFLCPVARKAPEFSSPNSTPSSVPNAKRGEPPQAGMASDFCYVATGRPGLGLGQ